MGDSSRDSLWKLRAEDRDGLLMIRTKEKSDRSVEVADPDLGGAGVEVEGAFLLDLGWGIRWGKDFDADLGRASEYEGSLEQLGTAMAEPGEVHCLNPVGCRNGAFGERSTPGEELQQKSKHLALAVGVHEARRGRHKDMSMPIGLDPIWELRELLVGQELGPAGEVEPGLRLNIGQLDGDRHEVKESMKAASKQRVKSPRALAIGCLGGFALLWVSISVKTRPAKTWGSGGDIARY